MIKSETKNKSWTMALSSESHWIKQSGEYKERFLETEINMAARELSFVFGESLEVEVPVITGKDTSCFSENSMVSSNIFKQLKSMT